jgi:hypothetical protein
MNDAVNELAAGQEDQSAAITPAGERPAYIPQKFWDAEAGTVRVEALAKSYGELERKLGARREPENGTDQHASILPSESSANPALEPASPVTPAAYQIEARHPMVTQDLEIDARLRDAGFSAPQAQLVYDLAAEKLVPLVDEVLGEIEAQRQLDRLEQHFGGREAWRQTAAQMKSWAAAHLPSEVAAALASNFDGIVALHQMMQASEPELLGGSEELASEITEDALAEMMRDPRYWRKRDPDFVARVTAGFRKLYAG